MEASNARDFRKTRVSANLLRSYGGENGFRLPEDIGAPYKEDDDLISASIPVPKNISIDPTAVEVTGLPSDVDVTCLRYYMEISTNFTAKVVSILFRSSRQLAVVHFSGGIDLKNIKDFISEVPLDDNHLFIKVNEVAEASAIQICGLEKPCTEHYAKLIVENYIIKNSLSAAICKVVMVDGIAVVALTSSTGCRLLVDAMRIAPQHYRSVVPFHKNMGITAETDIIYFTSGQSTANVAMTVGLRQPRLFIGGFTKTLDSEKFVRLFFSNSRSGGGECIEELLIDDKMVILRYASDSVADRVIDKIARRDLKFQNDSLWIAVDWRQHHTLMDGSVFILRNLPGTISRVALFYFLWAKACCRVLSLCFSLRKNMALVEFMQGVNFKSLYSAIADGEFLRDVGNGGDPNIAGQLELLQIPPVTCLQFSGVPESGSDEYVELLVQAMFKCHAEVEVHMNSGACALRLFSLQATSSVRFADLELEGSLLRVTPYHSMTGLTAEDEMSVAWLLPAPVALDFVEEPVLAHIVSSPAVRRALEEKLRLAHARLVELPDSSGIDGRMSKAKASVGGWSAEFLISDVGGASKESQATLHAQWRARVMRVIESFCKDFACELVKLDARIWPRVQEYLSESTSSVGGLGAISLKAEGNADDGTHCVFVVGHREFVRAAVDRAIKKAMKLGSRTGSNETAKESKSNASSGDDGGAAAGGGCLTIDVRRRELLYLQYKQLGKRLKADVNASISVTLQQSGRVSISGPSDTLQPAAVYIRSMLERLVHREVPLPTAAVILIVKREGYQHMVAPLKAIKAAAFWEPVAEVGITLCAESADDLEKAVGAVHAQLKMFDVKASDDKRSKTALSNPEFVSSVGKFRHQWEKKAVVVQLSADGLSAAATLPNASAIFDLLRLWELTAGQTRQVIHIDDILVFSLLRFHVRTLFGDKCVYISFEVKDAGNNGDIIVSAPAALGSAICDDVYSVLSRIHRSWHFVFGETRVKWLTSPAGQKFLKDSSRQGLTFSRYFKTERLENRLRPDGRRLVIVHGCAVLQSGQCLMIGSSPQLELTASFTGQHLLALGGEGIQNYINKNCKQLDLQQSDCFTTIGKKPYKAIVHVICPRYQTDPLAACNELLVFALVKGLQAASNKKYSSIVLPSIGSDGFGYPPDIGAELLVRALNMHFDKIPDSSIRDVIVADMNKAAVDSFNAAVNNSTVQESTKDKLATMRGSIITAGGLLVEIIRGDIQRQQVDAVVNCLLCNGDINDSGSASSRLSRAAGPELQHALQQACRHLAYGSQLIRGRVVAIKGYGLPCQHVINVCCGNRFETVGPEVLSSYIAACLRQADELRAKSVAVPLLGVDTLNVSAIAIAHATFLTLSTYRAQTLKVVYCVADDDASFEALQAKRHEAIGLAKAIEDDGMATTSSLCLAVLGLSEKNVTDEIAKISAELRERENFSNKDSDRQ